MKSRTQALRSAAIQEGTTRAPHRSLLHALGWDGDARGRPVIGIANSYSELIPGHQGLRQLAQKRVQRHLSPVQLLCQILHMLGVHNLIVPGGGGFGDASQAAIRPMPTAGCLEPLLAERNAALYVRNICRYALKNST